MDCKPSLFADMLINKIGLLLKRYDSSLLNEQGNA